MASSFLEVPMYEATANVCINVNKNVVPLDYFVSKWYWANCVAINAGPARIIVVT